MNELRDANTIEAGRLYPFATARLYIPSHQTDGPITVVTLHNWRKEGRFTAVYRPRRDQRKAWFIRGAAILELIGVEPRGKPGPKAARARPEAVEDMRAKGFRNL